MSITIVKESLWACRKCKSVLQKYYCSRCDITYLPVEYNFGDEPVNNPEECMEIYKRKLNRYKRMRANIKKEMKEWAAAGKAIDHEQWAADLDEVDDCLESLRFFSPPPNLNTEYSSSSDAVIYVYKQFTNRCIYDEHPIETVTVRTIDMRSKKSIDLNAYYCKRCKRYFINAEALNKYFYSKNIFPLLRLDLSTLDPTALKEYSELYVLGYTVKEGALTHDQRHAILADIIENGLIPKEQIIKKLQFLVRFNGNKPENQSAKEKWQSDILFVSQYTSDNRRRVNPVFVRK